MYSAGFGSRATYRLSGLIRRSPALRSTRAGLKPCSGIRGEGGHEGGSGDSYGNRHELGTGRGQALFFGFWCVRAPSPPSLGRITSLMISLSSLSLLPRHTLQRHEAASSDFEGLFSRTPLRLRGIRSFSEFPATLLEMRKNIAT